MYKPVNSWLLLNTNRQYQWDFFKGAVLQSPTAENKRPYDAQNTQHVGKPWQATEELTNGVWNLGWNEVIFCHLLINYLGRNKLLNKVSLGVRCKPKFMLLNSKAKAKAGLNLWYPCIVQNRDWIRLSFAPQTVAPAPGSWCKVFGRNLGLSSCCPSLLAGTSVLCPLGAGGPPGVCISAANQVRILTWLWASIPKKVWVYFCSSNQVSPWLVSSGTKGRDVGCSTEVGMDVRGGQVFIKPALLPSTCSNMTLNHISSRHVTYRIPPTGDNSPSVHVEGTYGLA